jgi:hypothetical protein
MTLQEHADEEALELAVVGLTHGELLGTARGGDGGAVGEAGSGEGEECRESFICLVISNRETLSQSLGKDTTRTTVLIHDNVLKLIGEFV